MDKFTNIYGRIYIFRNMVNGKVYIGQTVSSLRRKFNSYTAPSSMRRRHVPPILFRAISKYGADSFEIDELAVASSKEQLNALEILWISALRSSNPKYGYNIDPGGMGGRVVLTAEGYEKLHAPKSKEHRHKLSEGRKAMGALAVAHLNTPEIQKRKSEKLTGRIFSTETIRRMCAAAPIRTHRRWHVNRGIVSPNCEFCTALLNSPVDIAKRSDAGKGDE